MVTGETHTLTDTIMYYLFKFTCPTQSHIPWGSLCSQGLFNGQIPQQEGEKKKDNSPGGMHTETIQHNAIHSVVLCWNHPLML